VEAQANGALFPPCIETGRDAFHRVPNQKPEEMGTAWNPSLPAPYFASEIAIGSSRLCGASSSLSTGLAIGVSSEAVAVNHNKS